MLVQYLIVCCLLSVGCHLHSVEYISDSNLTKVLSTADKSGKKVNCFILSMNHYHLQILIQQMPHNYSQICHHLYVGLLRDNTYLQQSLRIKRYPYCGIVVYNQQQWHWYPMPDIHTPSALLNLATKVHTYIGDWTDGLLQQNGQNIDVVFNPQYMKSRGIDRQLFINQFMLNPIYYPLTFIPNPSIDAVIINHNHYEVSSIQQLHHLFTSFVINVVNQFSPHTFNALTDFYAHQQNHQDDRPYVLYMALLDSITHPQSALGYKNMLNEVMRSGKIKHRHQKVHIFWGQASLNKQKKQLLGFNINDTPPLLALFDPFSQSSKIQKYPMPTSMGFNTHNILSYLIAFQEQKSQQKQQALNQKLYQEVGIRTQSHSHGLINTIVLGIDYFDEQISKNLKMVNKRMNRFSFQQNIELVVNPRLAAGLYIKLQQIKQVQQILTQEQLSLDYTNLCHFFSQKIKNIHNLQDWMPPNWCIPEHQLRNYLINL